MAYIRCNNGGSADVHMAVVGCSEAVLYVTDIQGSTITSAGGNYNQHQSAQTAFTFTYGTWQYVGSNVNQLTLTRDCTVNGEARETGYTTTVPYNGTSQFVITD